MHIDDENKAFLRKLGIDNPLHQKIIGSRLPCGEIFVKDAFEDKTSVFINAPRALMTVEWKGIVTAFALLESLQS